MPELITNPGMGCMTVLNHLCRWSPLGDVAGHALTGGSALGTVAGAVGSGYVGNQLAR